MRLRVRLRRLAFRSAYALLRVYWPLRRPTVSGVKCVLVDQGSVLLIRQSYGARSWNLPGGYIRRGEPPVRAARREAAEELGVTIEDWAPIGEVTGTMHGRRDRLHCFRAEVRDPALALDYGELSEARWFAPGQLPSDLGRYVRQILGLARVP